MHSEICPICRGSGSRTTIPIEGDPVKKTCHGCNGKGWVEVRDEPVTAFLYPYVPTPSVPPYVPPYTPYTGNDETIPDWAGPQWVYTCRAAWPEGLQG